MAKSELEYELYFQMKAIGLPEPEKEYRFHPVRRWRFDYCYPDKMLAIEIEGGAWVNGRHNRGKGFEEDMRKYGAAMELGWNVYRCGGGMIKDGTAVSTIERLLEVCE